MKNTRNFNVLGWVAVAGLLAWSRPAVRERVADVLNVKPAVIVSEPSSDDKEKVAPITEALSGFPEVAAAGAAYYRDAATMVKSFPDEFDTVAELETMIERSTTLLTKIRPSKMPEAESKKVRDAVGDAMTGMLGKNEAAKLSPTRVAEVFEALSWAYGRAT